MKIETHILNNKTIAEVISDKIVLSTIDDALDLIGNLGYQGFEKVILYEKNITSDFFDLKTKIAGDILQKFTQYQMGLIIIGDFSKYESNSLRDFVFESNKGKQVNFFTSLSDTIEKLSKPNN